MVHNIIINLPFLCIFVDGIHILLLVFLMFDKLEIEHYLRSCTARVLNFASILGLSIDCNIHWEPVVNPDHSLSIPTVDGLVNANEIRWREILGTVVVEVCDEVVNQLPSMLSMGDIGRMDLILEAKADALPQLVVLVSAHSCPGKIMRGEVLLGELSSQADWRLQQRMQVKRSITPLNLTNCPA